MQNLSLEISTSSIVKVIILILLTWFLWLIRDVLIVIFLSIMISSAINPFTTWAQNKRIPRLLGVVILHIIYFGLIVFLLFQTIPLVSAELKQLSESSPALVFSLNNILDTVAQFDSPYFQFIFDIINDLQTWLETVVNSLQNPSQSLSKSITTILGGALSVIIVIVLSFYMSIMPNGFPTFIRSVLPDRYENYVIHLWKKSKRKLGRWFHAQFLLTISVGILVFITLTILDVPYAMILEIIPITGPIIAGILALILAFAQSRHLLYGY